MATATVTPPQTTPVFAPDGSIRQIPDQQLRDAFSAGAKLAVQVKTPNGDIHYIPHDQMSDALAAGGKINSEQGTIDEPHPKEGYLHSLGAVFGITPENAVAMHQQAVTHPWQTLADAADITRPLKGMVQSAITNVPKLGQKSMDENVQSTDALKRGDIKGFLAHQLGSIGYLGATAASPVLGDSPAKAGEQFGEGNIKGGLGTTTGILAPFVVPGAIKTGAEVAPKVLNTAGKVVKSAAVIGEPIPVVGQAIERLQRFKDAPQKLRDIWAKQAATDELTPEAAVPASPAPKPPLTSQVLKDSGVTQAMKDAGVAAPSASSRGIRPTTGSFGITGELGPRSDIQFPAGLTAEDAARMQLTRYNINELRSGAIKRGIKVAAGDTHAQLIDKISQGLKPEELSGFDTAAQASKVTPSKFEANNGIADSLNQAAKDIQTAKGSPYEVASLRNAAQTVRGYPEDIAKVDLTQTKIRGIDKRIGARIGDYLEGQKAPAANATPQYAYRVRDAGETGISPKGHAQATTDLQQAQSYVEGRGQAQNAPQEVVRIDLSKLDPKEYVMKTGPGGKKWVQFKNPVPESYIDKFDKPEVATESNIDDLLQRSLAMMRAKKGTSATK